MSKTLEEHKIETRKEWGGKTKYSYFPKVIEYLKTKDIKLAVDVGGCTGEVSNILIDNIDTLKKIIIIEPIPENYNFILNNVTSDRVEVVVINKALFYGEKYVSLGVQDSNVGGYSIKWNNTLDKIETTTIEDVCISDEIDLIKIDIEGAEINVIESSEKLKNIKYIEIEFHDEMSKPSSWKKFIQQFLSTHKVILTDEDILDSGSCCSHALLEKI
jgi:FkbM family methyltransferase